MIGGGRPHFHSPASSRRLGGLFPRVTSRFLLRAPSTGCEASLPSSSPRRGFGPPVRRNRKRPPRYAGRPSAWYARQDLNLRHLAPEASALSTELRALDSLSTKKSRPRGRIRGDCSAGSGAGPREKAPRFGVRKPSRETARDRSGSPSGRPLDSLINQPLTIILYSCYHDCCLGDSPVEHREGGFRGHGNVLRHGNVPSSHGTVGRNLGNGGAGRHAGPPFRFQESSFPSLSATVITSLSPRPERLITTIEPLFILFASFAT